MDKLTFLFSLNRLQDFSLRRFMATHASAEKAARQAEKRRLRNNAAEAKIRTSMKALRAAITKKEKNLPAMLSQVESALMKAVSKNLLKRGTASRYVSRLNSAIHKAQA
jgi:ribosomal protein S20